MLPSGETATPTATPTRGTTATEVITVSVAVVDPAAVGRHRDPLRTVDRDRRDDGVRGRVDY
jgi:hypothetical protein